MSKEFWQGYMFALIGDWGKDRKVKEVIFGRSIQRFLRLWKVA